MDTIVGHYLRQFESASPERKKSDPAWLNLMRQNAAGSLAATGFPSAKNEQWKYINISPVTAIPFACNIKGKKPARDEIAPFTFAGANIIVFVNGRYEPEFTRLVSPPELLRIESLSHVLKTNPKVVKPHLGRAVKGGGNPFAELNTAFMEDGVFIHAYRGSAVREAVIVLFVSTSASSPAVSYPRNLIVADESSQCVIVESYAGFNPGVSLTNAVTEIIAGPSSVVRHIRLQEEGPESYHMSKLAVTQAEKSSFTSDNLSFGAALSRAEISSLLSAEGCECTLNGLYMGRGSQIMDSHTRIEHLKPNGVSRELYKGILDEKSKGIFNGKIVVHKSAVKTKARQTNKNLLLSDDAEADPTPALEIFNDDVKVYHGSTVGQLDKDQIFYLRSRGIDESSARSLLTYAFASEVIDQINITPLWLRLRDMLLSRLPAGQAAKGAHLI